MNVESRRASYGLTLLALSPMIAWSVVALYLMYTQQSFGQYGPASLAIAAIVSWVLLRALHVRAPRYPMATSGEAFSVAIIPIVLWLLFSWIALHGFANFPSLVIAGVALSTSWGLWSTFRPSRGQP